MKNISQLLYNPEDYLISGTDVKVARKKISQILKVPTQEEYEEQKKLLEGEDCDNWEDFNSQVKKHLETEVMIHQVSNVIELGWEPATESRPGQLS